MDIIDLQSRRPPNVRAVMQEWGMSFAEALEFMAKGTVMGVKIYTRKDPSASPVKIVRAIAQTYHGNPTLVVKSVYEDDKNGAFFEIHLADDIGKYLAHIFAAEMVVIARDVGGYNGLQIKIHGESIRDEDSWWEEEWY